MLIAIFFGGVPADTVAVIPVVVVVVVVVLSRRAVVVSRLLSRCVATVAVAAGVPLRCVATGLAVWWRCRSTPSSPPPLCFSFSLRIRIFTKVLLGFCITRQAGRSSMLSAGQDTKQRSIGLRCHDASTEGVSASFRVFDNRNLCTIVRHGSASTHVPAELCLRVGYISFASFRSGTPTARNIGHIHLRS